MVPSLWHPLTRLGEMTLLMPAALLAALLLWHDDITRPLARRWLIWLVVGALFTTVTKLAFLGWGVGIAALDFTGVSGHAMFAAAIYPTLVVTLASRLWPLSQRVWLALGVLLAVAVGFSRIQVGAHSLSEVIAGLAVGGAVSAMALLFKPLPRNVSGWLAPLLVAAWLLVSPLHAPPSPTHSWVIKLSLLLAGKDSPYTRTEMLKRHVEVL